MFGLKPVKPVKPVPPLKFEKNMNQKKLNQQKLRRQKRVRAALSGTAQCPRLSVFRSSRTIYAQLIDDEKGITLCASGEKQLAKNKIKLSGDKKAKAFEIGRLLGEEATKKGIKKAVFDRGSFRYWGRVRSLAEGARKGGLVF